MIEEKIFLFDEFHRWKGFADSYSNGGCVYGRQGEEFFYPSGLGYTMKWSQLSEEQREDIMYRLHSDDDWPTTFVTKLS